MKEAMLAQFTEFEKSTYGNITDDVVLKEERTAAFIRTMIDKDVRNKEELIIFLDFLKKYDWLTFSDETRNQIINEYYVDETLFEASDLYDSCRELSNVREINGYRKALLDLEKLGVISLRKMAS